MQRRNFAILTGLIAVLSVAAWAADIAGTWTGTVSGGGNDMSLVYNFKQDSGKVTGTLTTPQGDTLPLIDLKTDGAAISFAVKVDMGGNIATFTSKGTVKGDEMSLTTTNDAGIDLGGEMKLKKQAK